MSGIWEYFAMTASFLPMCNLLGMMPLQHLLTGVLDVARDTEVALAVDETLEDDVELDVDTDKRLLAAHCFVKRLDKEAWHLSFGGTTTMPSLIVFALSISARLSAHCLAPFFSKYFFPFLWPPLESQFDVSKYLLIITNDAQR